MPLQPALLAPRPDALPARRRGPRSGPHRSRARWSAWGALAVAVIGAPASASDPELAREVGGGGASRADLGSLSAAATAPALLPLRPRYDVGGGIRFGPDSGITWQAAAVDSQTGPVALGLLVSRTTEVTQVREDDLPGWRETDTPIGERRDARTRLGGALAISALERQLGFGASVTWHHRTDGFDRSEGRVTAGASVAAHLGQQLVVSVNGENLIPTGLWFAPTLGTAGLRWAPAEVAALQGDLILDFSSRPGEVAAGARVGVEAIAGRVVPLRLGWAHLEAVESLDGDPEDRLTAGIGVGNAQAALDYGFQAGLDGGDDEGLRQWHAVSLRLSF